VKKKFKTKDVAFGQLNEQFIREYQDFVLGKQGYAMDTLRHYLAILKRICKSAYKEGHSERHYFSHYKLPKQKETTPKALSREDFEKLRDLEIPPRRRSHILTKDLFIFACYTGTAYADVMSITKENLFLDEEGSQWLKYRRKKTDYLGRVKLLPEALVLIGKYKDDSRETLFPKQDYHTLRANMKALRIMADLTQDLVYHMGRHSFASLITLEEGVPIETISKMLGHSNIQTTQIYARVTPKRLFEEMDKFIEVTDDLKLVL
jgi:integrase